MPKFKFHKPPKVRQRAQRSDKGVKRGPRVKPEVVEEEPVVEAPQFDELDTYLARFNASFGLEATREGLATAKANAVSFVHELRRQGVIETDIPLMLVDSIPYALYRIAQRFGMAGEGEDPLIAYGTVKSRFIEVMDR